MHYKKKLTFEHIPSFLHQDMKGCVWVTTQAKTKQIGTWFQISLGQGNTQTYSPL
jgi:outer membrane protease